MSDYKNLLYYNYLKFHHIWSVGYDKWSEDKKSKESIKNAEKLLVFELESLEIDRKKKI